jgi:hypothetical protein
LIVYSFEDYSAASFIFLPAASIFQLLFKRFTHFALVESTAASTLAAAVSTASPILFFTASVASSTLSLVSFLQETSTKVATRANPKMLSSCFVF